MMDLMTQELDDLRAIYARRVRKETYAPSQMLPHHFALDSIPPLGTTKTRVGSPFFPLPAQIANDQIWPTEVGCCPIWILLFGGTSGQR